MLEYEKCIKNNFKCIETYCDIINVKATMY